MVDRADSAPADIVPGLLTSTLRSAGVEVRVGGGASCTFSSTPTSDGHRRSTEKVKRKPPTRTSTQPSKFEVRALGALPSLISGPRAATTCLSPSREPPPPDNEALAIGIAGQGFDGNLTSDSTRLDGYVLSTDIAPTILGRLGIGVPDEMSGQPIRSEGERRPGGGRIAGRADGGDPRAARAGGRLRPARLARAAGARSRLSSRGALARPGGAARRPLRRLPAADPACSARRSSRARGSNSCWRSSARRCSRR